MHWRKGWLKNITRGDPYAEEIKVDIDLFGDTGVLIF